MKRRDVLKAGALSGVLALTGVAASSCSSETATMSSDSISLTDIPVGGGDDNSGTSARCDPAEPRRSQGIHIHLHPSGLQGQCSV